MNASLRLGRVWGIEIGLHWSLSLVFVLIVWSLGGAYFPDTYPDLPEAAAWGLAVLTGVLFFVSVLLHELGHSWVALREGLTVKSIVLFIFGGIAQIGQRSPTARTELLVAAGGPLVSLILTIVFGALALLASSNDYLEAPAAYLFRINLALLLFNLIPGFPLDGGRILRALVWQASGDERRASQVAMVSGQIAAFGFMLVGGLLAFNGDFADGIWLVLIGWFLQNAAASEMAGGSLERALEGVRVSQVMRTDWPRVPIRLKVRQLVDDYVLGPGAPGQRAFIVDDDNVDPPRGLVSLSDVAKLPRERWDWVGLNEIMVPWPRVVRLHPTTPLLEALRAMDDAEVNQAPVTDPTDEERVIGLLSREQILRHIRLRSELGLLGGTSRPAATRDGVS
jgi:Zn-dependent protease